MSSRERLWTPGPWDNKEITICDQDLIGISFSFLNTANRGHYEEGVANGRLMKAAPDLVEEHEEWASLLGEVYVLIQQADYSEAKRLLDGAVTIDFKVNAGEPAALSPSLDKAYGDSQ